MKKHLHVLSMVIIVCMASCSSDELLTETNQERDINTVQQPVAELVKKLRNSFDSGMTRSNKIIYPTYFGGLYANEEGKLVILVTEGDTATYHKDLSQRCRSNNFIIKPCEYSYNELFEVINRLELYLKNETNRKMIDNLKFYGFSLADNLNSIRIQLGNSSEDNIAHFKREVLDFPNFIFEASSPTVFESTPVYAGQDMLGAIVGGKASAGSVGFRAKRLTTAGVSLSGIVVSGHVIKQVGNPVYLNSTTTNIVAECQAMQWSDDIDAAFCFNKNGYEGSNHINNHFGDLSPQAAELYVGLGVSLSGRNTTSSGSIVSTFSSATIEGKFMSGIIQANYTSQGGDSGGIIFTGNLQIAGIHDAGPPKGVSGSRYFISAERIVETFGLTLY